MVIDTMKSIIDYIYNILTGDDAEDVGLQAIMGRTTWLLYHTWAKPDAAFPYLVHRLDIMADKFWPECDATYYLDIWSDSDDADETLNIRKRIIELLDELEFSTTEMVLGTEQLIADRARFTLQTNFFIPEIEQGIWHFAFTFNLRYFRVAEINAIDSR